MVQTRRCRGPNHLWRLLFDFTSSVRHPLLSVKIEAISVVLGEVQASKVVYACVGTVSRIEIRIVHYTVGQLTVRNIP